MPRTSDPLPGACQCCELRPAQLEYSPFCSPFCRREFEGAGCPTPQEIADACEAIRAAWTITEGSGTGPASIFASGAVGNLLAGASTWRAGEAIFIEASGDYSTKVYPAGSLDVVLTIGGVELTVTVDALPPSQVEMPWELNAKFTRRTEGPSGTIIGKAVLTLTLADSSELRFQAYLPSTVLSSATSATVESTFDFSTSGNEINVADSTVTKRDPLAG